MKVGDVVQHRLRPGVKMWISGESTRGGMCPEPEVHIGWYCKYWTEAGFKVERFRDEELEVGEWYGDEAKRS